MEEEEKICNEMETVREFTYMVKWSILEYGSHVGKMLHSGYSGRRY